jgi:phospholipase/lecithinase/hemolysin
LCPGLKIYAPDFFTLLNNVLTNAAAYGLTNALSSSGFSIDALTALYAHPPVVLNGPGTNYIFWDYMNPTAKLHEVMADVAQQLVSPVKISKLTPFNNGSNRLDVVNYPAGLSGYVDGSTNLALANWTSVANITSTNTTDSFFAPTNGSSQFSQNILPDPGGGSGSGSNGVPLNVTAQFYRLHFPYAWSWP